MAVALASCRAPGLLRLGESRGRFALAGSDPLPLQYQAQRLASYGSLLPGSVDIDAPALWIKSTLRELTASPKTFGGCRRLPGFARDQMLLRLRKRRR